MKYYAPAAPYFGPHGQVVYPPSGRKGYYLDESSLSHQLETQPRGRPRSNTAASEKLQISAGPAEPYRLALDGYTSGPAGHEGKGGFFSSFVSSIRSRSKSKSRDGEALYPARSSGSSAGVPSYTQVDSRGRAGYEKSHHKMRDPADELARQMEKDLRLQDMEDPYRPVRRDRSSSVNSRKSERRNRDLDPDVRDNTQYNAHALKYMPRMHSDPHASGGYHTDAQPQMLRRSTTSRTNPASHGAAATLIGWYNQRGDQFIKPGTVICQPKELQYSRRFHQYPEVGKGYGDAKGNVIDAYGHLIKRVG